MIKVQDMNASCARRARFRLKENHRTEYTKLYEEFLSFFAQRKSSSRTAAAASKAKTRLVELYKEEYDLYYAQEKTLASMSYED